MDRDLQHREPPSSSSEMDLVRSFGRSSSNNNKKLININTFLPRWGHMTVSAGPSAAAHNSALHTTQFRGLVPFLVPLPYSLTKLPGVTSQMKDLSQTLASAPVGTQADTAHGKCGPERSPQKATTVVMTTVSKCRSPSVSVWGHVPRSPGIPEARWHGILCALYGASPTACQQCQFQQEIICPSSFYARCFLCLATLVLRGHY